MRRDKLIHSQLQVLKGIVGLKLIYYLEPLRTKLEIDRNQRGLWQD